MPLAGLGKALRDVSAGGSSKAAARCSAALARLAWASAKEISSSARDHRDCPRGTGSVGGAREHRAAAVRELRPVCP
jgi:hypothetical protein